MKLNRVTKGAARFEEVLEPGEPEILGNIYMKRWALGAKLKGIPVGNVEGSTVTIKVTVDA